MRLVIDDDTMPVDLADQGGTPPRYRVHAAARHNAHRHSGTTPCGWEAAAKAVRRRTATRLGRRRRCSRGRCDRPSRAVTDARLHLDLHVRPLHADRVARDALRRGGPQHGAGLDVVDGPMPRARHLLARHLALTERAAAVRAGVVDGVEAPLQVEEGDLLPSNFDALRRARREVGSVRDLDELRHMSVVVVALVNDLVLINEGGTVAFVVNPAAVRSSTLRVASWSRASPENRGLSPAAAPSSGWCCFVRGTTNQGETPDVGPG